MALDRSSRQRPAQRYTVLAVEVLGLAILWLLFSGKFDALHLAFGALSILIVLAMSGDVLAPTGPSSEVAQLARVQPLRALAYLAWLVREIVVANIDIARLVLHPRMPIDPVLGCFRTHLPGRLPKVALGNSITLTPGTLTLHIRGTEVIVHAITPGSATGPTIDEMERRLAAVFGAPPPAAPVAMSLSRDLPPARGAQRP